MVISADYVYFFSVPLQFLSKTETYILRDVKAYNYLFIDRPFEKGEECIDFHRQDGQSDRYMCYKIHVDTYFKIIENEEFEIDIRETVIHSNLVPYSRSVFMYVEHEGLKFELILTHLE